MFIASNDIKKYMPHPGWKIYVFQNTLMTSHKCGATLNWKVSQYKHNYITFYNIKNPNHASICTNWVKISDFACSKFVWRVHQNKLVDIHTNIRFTNSLLYYWFISSFFTCWNRIVSPKKNSAFQDQTWTSFRNSGRILVFCIFHHSLCLKFWCKFRCLNDFFQNIPKFFGWTLSST